ncbi:hypothetical protein FACS1894102_5590 [Spirochaetia bacterium]|nr:hypothetical protein FACS1894102_5590 [Spirochaetia bacterium]
MKMLKKLAAAMPVLAAIAIFAIVMSCSSSDGNPYIEPEGRPDGDNQAGMPTIAGISIASSGNFVGFNEHFQPNLRTYNIAYETPISGEIVNMEAYRTPVTVHLFTDAPKVLSLVKPTKSDISSTASLEITFSEPEEKLSTKVYCYDPADISRVGIYTVNNHGLETHTVTFDPRGGEWDDVVGNKKALVKHGYTVAQCVANYSTYFRPLGKASADPDAYHYEFVGWSPTTGWTPGALWNYDKQVSGNITVYAAWDENHNRSLIPEVSPPGNALPTNTQLTITAANADRFYYTTDGTTPDVFSTCITGPSAQIDTSFIPDSGQGVLKIISSRDMYNESIVRVETYTKAKLSLIGAATERATSDPYTPSGFTTDPSGGTVYYSSTSGGTDYSLTAKPTLTVTQIGTGYTLKAIAKKAGYLDSDPASQVITGGYTVTFDDQGATTAVNPATITNIQSGATVVTLPTAPAKTDHIFGGWWSEKDGAGTEFKANTQVYGSRTVYAKWTRVYTVTFDGDGATTAANPGSITNILYNATVTLPTAPTKTNLFFDGWWTAKNGAGTEFKADTPVTSSITVYAKWISGYTITFDGDGATTAANPSSIANIRPGDTVVTLPVKPAKTGFTFVGWWTAKNGVGTEFKANTPVTSSYTVYAKWQVQGLKLTFNTAITQIPFDSYTDPYLAAGETQYSLDGSTWVDLTSKTQTIPSTTVVYLKGNFGKNSTSSNSVINGLQGLFANIATLIKAEGDIRWVDTAIDGTFSASIATEFRYYAMFTQCANLTTAPDLPATTLAYGCYSTMFRLCESLTTAPVLPATTLATGCYVSMFSECKSLKTAPALPATTLATMCYDGMFRGCTSLTTAPALPATTLATMCYRNMFWNCNSLTTAPALPATTLAESCYEYMFFDCKSLATAPALPATTLANGCYASMFQNCESLTTAPALPATTLAVYCYSFMFGYCKSLTTAPALPATTLYDSCYSAMFEDCTSLTTAPALPATTLATNCYFYMFASCRNLTTAPALPATTLASSCYESMFSSCIKLNNITVKFTNWNTTNATRDWLSGVSATGTFNKPSALANTTGIHNIPSGWTVVNQ